MVNTSSKLSFHEVKILNYYDYVIKYLDYTEEEDFLKTIKKYDNHEYQKSALYLYDDYIIKYIDEIFEEDRRKTLKLRITQEEKTILDKVKGYDEKLKIVKNLNLIKCCDTKKFYVKKLKEIYLCE